MAGRAKVGVKGFKDGQEALSVARRLEALQCPFSPSGPLMRVLDPVVEVAALAMLGVGQQLFESGPVQNAVCRLRPPSAWRGTAAVYARNA